MDRSGSVGPAGFSTSPNSTTPIHRAKTWLYRVWQILAPNGLWTRRVCPIPDPNPCQYCIRRRTEHTSMASSTGRDFVLEVIEKYRQHPCLWQIRNVEYHDKIKRNRALDEFLEIFRTKDPQASRELVQKKLSSIRGAYNKERRKVKASMTTGSDPESVHVPKLWYYSHLSFLQDEDTPRSSMTTSSILDEMPFEDEESNDPFVDQLSPTSQRSSSSSRSFKRPQPKADQVLEKIAKLMERPITYLTTQPAEKQKQEHDAFGEYVAEKLRSLPTSMVPFVQKIMNDVIFLGEMESLNISSRIVTDPPPSTGNQNPNPAMIRPHISSGIVTDPHPSTNQDPVMSAYYRALDPIQDTDINGAYEEV